MGDLEMGIGDATFIDESMPVFWRDEREGGPPSNGAPARASRALGWFSIGLGLAELAAPRAVARLIGAPGGRRPRRTLRAVGLREIAAGVGLLLQPRGSRWLWSRVAGDLIDLGLLRAAAGARGARTQRLLVAAGIVTGVAVVDAMTGLRVGRASSREGEQAGAGLDAVEVTAAITVNRSTGDVFRFWRDLENLPRFMENVESVRALDDRRSHWRARTLGGRTVEWDAEIVGLQDGRMISWRSAASSDARNEGTVTFASAPGNRGTEVRVTLRYQPPAGRWTAAIAKLFGKEPGQQVRADLRRFKQVMEIGEVVKSDTSIHRGPHPARPSRASDQGERGIESPVEPDVEYEFVGIGDWREER
ncbi:MAG TPA: SRPBCC family protein [Polyangia bacterium]|nr:SRPBCC family protein [Polyangia bacterium]